MTRQIRLLMKLSLRGMFGLNELRFTKDRRKKARGLLMGGLWVLVIGMLAIYIGMFSYGYLAMGLGDFLPAVLGLCVTGLVFFFTLFKAGAVLFDKNAYEKEISLPVTVRAIIVSRFLSMYVTDLLLGIVVMAPGVALYGVMERPGISFYIYGLVAMLFLPLLPLTVASIAGALIAGIASKVRRKNLVSIVLTLIFVCVVMIGSMAMGGMDEEQIEIMLRDFALQLEVQIRRLYPPAMWLSEAMVQGKFVRMAQFLGVSFGCFFVFLELLQPVYGRICILLGVREVKGNYRMKGLGEKTVLGSLVERELRHYFSSSVHVTNTLVGEIMMVLLAVGVLVIGKESVEGLFGIPGVVQRGMPILLGCMPAMMPITACSISLEGKQWWMLQTLPVSRQDIAHSKVVMNLIVALPFYLVSEALFFVALRPGWADGLSLLVMPLLYLLFSARMGLAVNEKFPVFDWDNEVKVVKQSASVFGAMLIGLASAVLPLGVLLVLPEISAYGVYAVVAAILAVATVALEMGERRSSFVNFL